MIGIDTNILVRSYLQDDLAQAKIAQEFLAKYAKSGTLFISSYAILEFVWVLKVNKFSRNEISKAIELLVDASGIIIGQREVVTKALNYYKNGKADFGDYIIISEGEINGCKKLKTFDKELLKEIGQ